MVLVSSESSFCLLPLQRRERKAGGSFEGAGDSDLLLTRAGYQEDFSLYFVSTEELG